MALNIVFGGALGNITASQVLDIPASQLTAAVRLKQFYYQVCNLMIATAVSTIMRPCNASYSSTHPTSLFAILSFLIKLSTGLRGYR
jgi:hypothetical protein